MLPATSASAVPTGPGDPAGAQEAELSETSLRLATIQADLSGDTPESLNAELLRGNDRQATLVAEKIASANADIVVLTEMDADQDAVDTFNEKYLANPVDQRADVDYQYAFLAVGSKGRQSGADLNSDGVIGSAEDAWGQGAFEEQGSVVVLSKYPIDAEQVTGVSQLKWQDVEHGQLGRTDFSGALAASIPVMSTGLWDIPIEYRGQRVHVVATQTQPESRDRGFAAARQSDELKVIEDYLAGEDYVHSDSGEPAAGIAQERFVVAGALALQENSQERIEPFLAGLEREDALNASGSYLIPDSSWQVLGQGRIEQRNPSQAQPMTGAIPQLIQGDNPLIWTDIEF